MNTIEQFAKGQQVKITSGQGRGKIGVVLDVGEFLPGLVQVELGVGKRHLVCPSRMTDAAGKPVKATAPDYAAALRAGLEAGRKAGAERSIGCCRVYVCVDRVHAKGMEEACQEARLIFQVKAHYGMSNALYVGYDNCSGVELAKGAAMVAALKAAGIGCYREVQGD